MHVFEPKSREEISAIRLFLKEELLEEYIVGSRIWLGFVRPRQSNGTGWLGVYDWYSERVPGYEPIAMNHSMFNKEDSVFSKDTPEPNNREGDEYCMKSEQVGSTDKAYDTPCYSEATGRGPGYGVCEVEMES